LCNTIQVLSQEALPKWDRAFGDLYAQIEQDKRPHGPGATPSEDKVPRGKFPKVTKRAGNSPPQYAEDDEQVGRCATTTHCIGVAAGVAEKGLAFHACPWHNVRLFKERSGGNRSPVRE
jgi:hypothetical protein